jgi:hypothetical protein
MPLPTHSPYTQCVFARSFFADESRSNEKYYNNKKEAVACQGARPGVWPCEVAAIGLT